MEHQLPWQGAYMCQPGAIHRGTDYEYIRRSRVPAYFCVHDTHGIKEQPGMAIAIGTLYNTRPMLPTDEDACFVQYWPPWEEIKTRKDQTQYVVKKRLWCHFYTDVKPIIHQPWKGSQGWRKLQNDFAYELR